MYSGSHLRAVTDADDDDDADDAEHHCTTTRATYRHLLGIQKWSQGRFHSSNESPLAPVLRSCGQLFKSSTKNQKNKS